MNLTTVQPSSVFLPETGMHALPLDSMFASLQPVEIDIGCGKGGFLLARAKAHPDTNFIGIERMLKRVRKVDSKILRAGLTNVRLLRQECMHAVRNMLPEQSIRTAYIFFSDPWPKRRHNTRRLFSGPFLDALATAVQRDGMVHVMTDHLEYFQIIQNLFTKNTRFEPVQFPVFPESERTDFEKVFEKLNRPIGRGSYRKTG